MHIIDRALIVDKRWQYLIEQVWKIGKWLASDANSEFDLVATSSPGENLSLKILQTNEYSKMLGVQVAPDGNKNTVIKGQKSAIEWGSKVRSVNSSREEAW